jgi:beta-N-acetylhexosaminidase
MGQSRLWQVVACVAVLACAVAAGWITLGGGVGKATAPTIPGATASKGTGAAATDGPTTGTLAGACVNQVLESLSLAQRVGQLFLVGVTGDIAGPEIDAAEKTYHFGSLLLNVSAAGTATLAGRTAVMQSLASSGTGGVKFFIAANQEGGKIQQLTGPGFATMPSAVEQGGWSASTLRQSAANWGTELRAAGVNLDLAPVMDVVPAGTAASNAPIGALEREFGSDPASVGAHGVAFIQGMSEAGVATVAKHFPGLGRVTGNTDFAADVVDNVTTASDPDLNSFRTAINAGVPMVMVALATYTKIDKSRLAAFSPVVMSLLRDKFGFGGVIISDDLGAAQAVKNITEGTRAIDFLTAGGDMITSQELGPAEQMAAAVLAKAQGNRAFRATVNAAASQVLAAKQSSGLLSC